MKKIFYALMLTLAICQSASAEEEPQLIKVTATYYDIDGTTASGTHTRPGVMAARRDWIGMTAILYTIREDGRPGEVIGYYQIEDTGEGKNGAIRKGYVVDIWSKEPIPTQKVFLQLVDANG